VVLGEREESAPSEMMSSPVVRSGGKGVGFLVASGATVHLEHFAVDAGRRGSDYEDAEGLVYGPDGASHAYAARRGGSWFVVVNGQEGPPFDRVVTPVFSPDGRWVAYRARKDGKRFVVLAETSGKTVRLHPAYEQVFPVQFSADGKAAVYGVKDGRQLAWKVEAL
jgi:hypothetical protein